MARTTSAPAFQILEIMPAIAPRAARGRTNAAGAVGCADLAPTNLAPLTSKITPPPPHLLFNNIFSQHLEGNQAVGQPHQLC
jgi:hypothetical protein